jgi:hypothetical protein
MNKSGMFAAYWGAKVAEVSSSNPNHIVVTGTMTGIEADRIYRDGCSFIFIEKCKLILTPLSQVSDLDLLEVSRINVSTIASKPTPSIEDGRKYISEFTLRVGVPLHDAHIIDYLRSPIRPDGTSKPCYDVGYMDCDNLINAGYAIVADKDNGKHN